ncbi:putative alanine racemase-domain-containing protein [Gymnopilus junonius]|uniref:Alanine racemase-domain-containing protein n=1 Tax=Gymnopilus junonius TaxID=109634 RepID=A0A9P5NRI2_GYMJU|nr:putative alanine racemase-domain-containing protein [Gymnopilus junonius]
MMPSVSDALEHPRKVISSLYQAQDIDIFPGIVTAHFNSIFKSKDTFQQIPSLNLQRPPQSFPDGSLVVFNAMVQDTSLSPELYLAVLNNGACGGWGISEGAIAGDRVRHEYLRECNVFWAVSIPGLSSWCLDQELVDSVHYQSTQPNKFPVPNASHIGVQLKIYDSQLARPIRATDVMSFVGILTSEPFHINADLTNFIHVPTLHVLYTAPLPSTIVPRSFPDKSLSIVKTVRQELIQWIAREALAGDLIASEWVLLCALARVRSRHPPVLPLSMTLSSFPSPVDNLNSTPALYHTLSQVFPLVSFVPLSLETLNNVQFSPESKDEDLHSGYLQHPKGSILLLTEGQVTEGGIFNKGIMNIRSTQEMMREQTLSYVFPFCNFQFETDVNFLVTTEGKRSTFFQTGVNVPFRPTSSGDPRKTLYKPREAIVLPSPEKLSQFRRLVGGSKIGNVLLGEELGKHVEEDFIRERSSTNREVNSIHIFSPDDLVKRMILARLVALSFHQAEVTIDNWERAKALEGQIKFDV